MKGNVSKEKQRLDSELIDLIGSLKIGNLDDLLTNDKSSVINAMNELAEELEELRLSVDGCEELSERIVAGEV